MNSWSPSLTDRSQNMLLYDVVCVALAPSSEQIRESEREKESRAEQSAPHSERTQHTDTTYVVHTHSTAQHADTGNKHYAHMYVHTYTMVAALPMQGTPPATHCGRTPGLHTGCVLCTYNRATVLIGAVYCRLRHGSNNWRQIRN